MSKILQAAASSGLQARYLTLRHAAPLPAPPLSLCFFPPVACTGMGMGCLSKKTCWLIEWNHFVLILFLDFGCLFKWCFSDLAWHFNHATSVGYMLLHINRGNSSPPPPPLPPPRWFLVSKIKEKYCSNCRWRNKAGCLWCQAAAAAV